MKKRSLLVLSLAFLLVGCINIKRNPSSNNISNQSGGGGNSFTSSVSEEDLMRLYEQTIERLLAKDAYKDVAIDEFKIEKRTIASQLDVTFDDFFNPYNKVSIKIDISDSELQLLQKDFEEGGPQQKTDKYRHAQKVTISLTNSKFSYLYPTLV